MTDEESVFFEAPQIDEIKIHDSLSDEEEIHEKAERKISVYPEQSTRLRRSNRSTKGKPAEKFTYKAECSRKMEPVNWDDMMQFPKQERSKWIAAVKEELQSLAEHKVWEICSSPGKQEAYHCEVGIQNEDGRKRIPYYLQSAISRTRLYTKVWKRL